MVTNTSASAPDLTGIITSSMPFIVAAIVLIAILVIVAKRAKAKAGDDDE